ncbi:MAG: gluconokinase [Terriglobales bacterium]|jgi:gluconokinase
MIVVLMGVSGVGKTTVGQLLAVRTQWRFEDADDYHAEENRQKMAAGIPLTDADRVPWLTTLHDRMLQYRQKGQSLILACSALKQQYREMLASGFTEDELHFVYLHAPAALIKERMRARHHPYFDSDLLESQLATLEVPANAWPVTVTESPEQAVDQILSRLRAAGWLGSGTKKPSGTERQS